MVSRLWRAEVGDGRRVFDAIFAAASDLPELAVPAGGDVIVEGTERGPLFVLATGAVEVIRAGVTVANIDEPGAIFGEMATLLESPATATVRARSECTFRVCDAPDHFLRSRPEVAHAVAIMLARRLDVVTRYLVDVREQYADRDDHLGMVDVVLESLSHHQGAQPDAGSDREPDAPY